MIVIDNGGGGTFRFIASTSGHRRTRTAVRRSGQHAVAGLAAAFGWDFHHASSAEELRDALDRFFTPSERPAILAVDTLPADESASILTNLLKES